MSKTILVTGTSAREDLLQPLRDAGFKIENPMHLLSEEELGSYLKRVDGYLLGGDEVATRKALSHAKALKIVAFLGVGYESFVDSKAAREHGVAVTNTPGTLAQSVAEFTIGQTLNAARRLSVYGRYMREHGAEGGPAEEKQHELKARRVGIIGLGTIGTRIAEILTNGFGCAVSYWSRTRKQPEEKRLGLVYRDKDALLANSDILILMTPGNASTKGLIGARELGLLPNGAILINTARPDLVDAAGLLGAFERGKVATAVFDKFYDDEVPERAKLLALGEERLIVTRHIGSLTHEARDGMTIKAVRSIISVLKTGKDENIVN